jgi:hypothetical protein
MAADTGWYVPVEPDGAMRAAAPNVAFMIHGLLSSRVAMGFADDGPGEDDVNIYLAHLLCAYCSQSAGGVEPRRTVFEHVRLPTRVRGVARRTPTSAMVLPAPTAPARYRGGAAAKISPRPQRRASQRVGSRRLRQARLARMRARPHRPAAARCCRAARPIGPAAIPTPMLPGTTADTGSLLVSGIC